jgi:hypothetical protein
VYVQAVFLATLEVVIVKSVLILKESNAIGIHLFHMFLVDIGVILRIFQLRINASLQMLVLNLDSTFLRFVLLDLKGDDVESVLFKGFEVQATVKNVQIQRCLFLF